MFKHNSSLAIPLLWFTPIILKYLLWPLSGIVNIHRPWTVLSLCFHATFFQFSVINFIHETCMLPSCTLISVWFIAPGYSLDLLFIIISVGFIVWAKKHSQCCGKIPNICTFTQWDPPCFLSNSASVSNSLWSYTLRIVLMLKVNYSHNASSVPQRARVRASVSTLWTHTQRHAHWNRYTLNICVVVALLSSGQAWCAGAGGAGGAGGVQLATGALWVPPAWRGPPTQ